MVRNINKNINNLCVNLCHNKIKIVAVCLVVILVTAAVIYRFKPQEKLAKVPLPVVTTSAHPADIPIYLTELGSVTSTATVTIKTKINGQLINVLFHEGQKVKQGDLLAEIDQRPYEAQLIQYEGQLARDTALLNNAKIDLARYKKLFKQDSIAKQTFDTQQALVNQYIGDVKIDDGLIAGVKLNLSYCKITSPIDGRVGLRLVDTGNYIQISDANGLVVINTINPITVTFSIPEDDLSQVLQQTNAAESLTVEAYDRTQNQLLAVGKLLSIDNQIDPTTGTIKLKAQFANDSDLLFPNQFVNIKLLVKTLSKAITVPTAAIQYGANKTFVYSIRNNIATIKTVKVGPTYKDDTVIFSGINAEDVLVTEGADRLNDGSIVTITNTAKDTNAGHGQPHTTSEKH